MARLVEPRTKAKVVHPQEFSPSPTQPFPHFGQHPNPRPSILIASNEACWPNLQQPLSTALPTFMATSRHVDQSSDSRGKPNGQKTGTDKTQWDPIPITYTELLPKLINSGFIMPIHLVPLRPPFSRWYDVNVRCVYHVGIPSHSTEIAMHLNTRSEI